MAALFRAFFGYVFLVLVVRLVARRPGKQLTPFEFVLVFFVGGLALTAMVGDDPSFTNAVCLILGLGCAHASVVWLRSRSPRLARLVDGTPLVLLEAGAWHPEALQGMLLQVDDVMASARDHGVATPRAIGRAVLERNGEITIRKAPASPAPGAP